MKNSKTFSIDDLVQEFNNKHAAVMLAGKFAILTETINPATGYPEIHFSRVGDIKSLYRNQKIERVDEKGKIKLINPTDIWLDDPNRRQYRGVVFCPDDTTPNGYYNLWNGFAVEPAPGDCSLYVDHIRANICGANEELYIWVVDWMADAVQNPANRPGSALVLRGEQGTGKGVFTTKFGKLFGSHFVHVSGQHRLTGKFNNHLKMGLIVFVDEGFWAGDRRDAGTLKAMITEKYMLIEPKFQDAFTLRNHIRVIMASNNEWVVPADLEERRFCVLDVGNRNQKDYPYFKAIDDQMKNGGYEALLHDLLSREITSNVSEIPRTQALYDQMISSMDSFEKWWITCLLQEKITNDDQWWPERKQPKNVYQSYQNHCDIMKERHPVPYLHFFRRLKKLCPGVHTKKINVVDGRLNYTHFPELEVCRAKIESRIKITIDWDQDEVPF